MHQWFLSFKMCVFNSLDPSCLQNAWFWRVMFKILCIYPLYQCLCNSEKDRAGPGIQSSKWAHLPVLPAYWSVDWFLRFIEMHTLPRSQGTSMTATLRGGSFLSQRLLLAMQEFFLMHIKRQTLCHALEVIQTRFVQGSKEKCLQCQWQSYTKLPLPSLEKFKES